jgi:galactitol-specific phosphotransferase system IIB component
MMKMKVEKILSREEIKKILVSEISKSEKMKKLFMGGLDVKSISEMMNVRYNFVYNVVSNMIRVNDMEKEVVKEVKENKKDEIIKLLKEGKSNIEICKKLKCNYNYVWKVVNEELKK